MSSLGIWTTETVVSGGDFGGVPLDGGGEDFAGALSPLRVCLSLHLADAAAGFFADLAFDLSEELMLRFLAGHCAHAFELSAAPVESALHLSAKGFEVGLAFLQPIFAPFEGVALLFDGLFALSQAFFLAIGFGAPFADLLLQRVAPVELLFACFEE